MTDVPRDGRAGEVLIVDDNPANLDILAALLRGNGYRFRVATSGHRAIASAQAQRPDIVMLDITMPEMNGYQVCEALKGDPRTAEIPVIFVSALDDALDKVRAFRAGGADYVTKPFQLEEVLARLENQLKISRLQEDLAHRNRELSAKNEQLEEMSRELAAANRELLHLSRTDQLTGLANRRRLMELLESGVTDAARSGRPFSLLIVDIDDFKQYNDHYGHQGGDECLRRVGACLRDSLQETDAIVGRYGGEEFVAGFPGLDDASSLGVARALCDSVRGLAIPHERSRVTSVVTISGGLSTLAAGGAPALPALLGTADAALYRAKREGRDRVVAE